MRANIVNGSIDYLIKDAHSDGDEKNLFRVASRAEVHFGRKTDADGFEQIIFLAIPDYGVGGQTENDELIANRAFGEWIREREASGGGPLLYLNSSCSSYFKAVHEISAARSKNLVIIPSISSVRGLNPAADNAQGAIVRGILMGQDWTVIQANLLKNPLVAASKEDVFILPNDPHYDDMIRRSLGIAIDSEVRITNAKTGKVINLDEFNRD